MPSKKAYDLVSDDGYDSRIPLHNEEAFQHGLQFQAKYIGTLDVPRPSSRVEIVAAMRRIRYEFKAKAIKKKKVILTISVDGVKVTLRKKKKSHWSLEESRLLIMQHPIHRIFYVSHDSQDLKIWSYIARDGPSNVFKCNVFKAYKKSQAMRIVRTIGQAFEVCHKLTGHSRPQSEVKEDEGEEPSEEDNEGRVSKSKESNSPQTASPSRSSETKENNNNSSNNNKNTNVPSSKPHPPKDLSLQQSPDALHGASRKLSPFGASPTLQNDDLDSSTPDANKGQQLPLSQHHQMQLMRQQLEQQQHQTQVAIAQVHLLKDQLSAETSARIEAQARSHQLLLHNKDLLDHISILVSTIQTLEIKIQGAHPQSVEAIGPLPTQIPPLPDATTARPAPVYLPDLRSSGQGFGSQLMEGAGGVSLFANAKVVGLDADSPDSGHKEMSSESLTFSLASSESQAWSHPYGIPASFACARPDSLVNSWFSQSNNSSVSPPSSSPSKSSTLKAGSTSSVDNQSNINSLCSSSSIASMSNTSNNSFNIGSSNEMNRTSKDFDDSSSADGISNVFQTAMAFRNDAYKSPNLYRSPSDISPLRKEAVDKIKIISSSPRNSYPSRLEMRSSMSMPNSITSSPLSSSSPSSSSARLSTPGANSTPNGVTSTTTTPKLDPPPKFRRSGRPLERWERGSWGNAPSNYFPPNYASESDYYSHHYHPHSNNNNNNSGSSSNNSKGACHGNQNYGVPNTHGNHHLINNNNNSSSHYNIDSSNGGQVANIHTPNNNNYSNHHYNRGDPPNVVLRCQHRRATSGHRYSDSSARSSAAYSDSRDVCGLDLPLDPKWVNDLNAPRSSRDLHSLQERTGDEGMAQTTTTTSTTGHYVQANVKPAISMH